MDDTCFVSVCLSVCLSFLSFFNRGWTRTWKDICLDKTVSFVKLLMFRKIFKKGLARNLSKKCLSLNTAKTPWSWGRMHDILSEGRKIESSRQLIPPSQKDQKTRGKIWKRYRTQARERPETRGRAFSEWTRSETRKVKKRKRDSIRRM